MKTKSFIAILLLTIVTVTHAQSTKTVELPYVAHSNTTVLEISKVTLTEKATILDIEAFFRPNFWIRVVSDSYLFVDGKKYMISDGDGIDLDSLFWMPASGEASFRLIFDPIPENSTSFDFIESDCVDCFKIWGVDLTNSQPSMANIPNEYLQSSNAEPTIVSDWKKGKAKVSGQLMGYKPNIDMEATILYFNPITSRSEPTSVPINEDGTFSVEVDMYNPSQVTLTYKSPQADEFWFIASPNEETKVIVNLAEANRLRTKLKRSSPSYGNRLMFSGYNATLNEELHNGLLTRDLVDDSSNQKLLQDISGMTMQKFNNYIMGKYNSAIDANNALNVSQKAKKIANMELAFKVNNYLASAESYLFQSYMDEHKVSWEVATKSVGKIEKDESFNNYLKQLPYKSFDNDLLLTKQLSYNIMIFNYLSSPNDGPFVYFKYLLTLNQVKQDDKDIITDFLSNANEDEPIVVEGPIAKVISTYSDLQQEYFDNRRGINYLSKLWDTDDCHIFDIMSANQITRNMQDFIPLTKKNKEEDIKKLPAVMQEVILEQNNILVAKIEENKKKTGYTILETPEVDNSNLFAEMIKPFVGKVILVDIWATWCGPCRAANIEMEPIKAQFANQDLVYLYLAGEDSPINTWENMITDLHGFHYRIDSSSWSYLREELKSAGVPTYLIIDKVGNQSFHSVGFPGSDTIKRELTKQLNM